MSSKIDEHSAMPMLNIDYKKIYDGNSFEKYECSYDEFFQAVQDGMRAGAAKFYRQLMFNKFIYCDCMTKTAAADLLGLSVPVVTRSMREFFIGICNHVKLSKVRTRRAVRDVDSQIVKVPMRELTQSAYDLLPMSVRLSNTLKANGVKTVRDLVSLSRDKMIATSNVGKATMRELDKILMQAYGVILE